MGECIMCLATATDQLCVTDATEPSLLSISKSNQLYRTCIFLINDLGGRARDLQLEFVEESLMNTSGT